MLLRSDDLLVGLDGLLHGGNPVESPFYTPQEESKLPLERSDRLQRVMKRLLVLLACCRRKDADSSECTSYIAEWVGSRSVMFMCVCARFFGARF